MAEDGNLNSEKAFREQNKTAFVLGYTGEVGKELVKALVRHKIFSQVVLIGRRKVEYDDETLKTLEQKVIDFDKLEDFVDAFKGFDVGYSCLGTTRGKSGADGFYKVDHDYVVNTAKLAKDGGCKQFHLVSSAGADKKSSFLYPKTKGEVEDEISNMGFENVFIYRPGLLLSDRTEQRTGEKAIKFLLKPITWGFPTFISIPTATVAEAMVNKAVTSGDKPVEIFDNKAIHRLGATACKPLLLSDRTEQRTGEKAIKFLLKPITWGFPTFISIRTATVAEAMTNKTLAPGDKPVEVFDNKAIHCLGDFEKWLQASKKAAVKAD